MDKTKQNIIKNIAQDIDCGFICYYNSKTEEVISIPNISEFTDEEEYNDLFQTSLNTIEKNKLDLIKIEALDSTQSFKIMELFTEQVIDKKLKSDLEHCLSNKRPFSNFKNKIDYSEQRQDWFDFKQTELEKMVEQLLFNG